MEKELLSIIKTSQQYRHILLGNHCTFYCDHKNLGFDNFRSERVHRWKAILEEFDYSFVYCPGKDNVVADMLSRYATVPLTTSDFEEVTTLQDFSFPATSSNIKQSQDSIPDLTSKLSTSSLYTTIHRDGFDLITRNSKIVLGPALFADILAWYHTNLNHPGQDCTYNTIHATFYTPNM
jgi:hypothetical protein